MAKYRAEIESLKKELESSKKETELSEKLRKKEIEDFSNVYKKIPVIFKSFYLEARNEILSKTEDQLQTNSNLNPRRSTSTSNPTLSSTLTQTLRKSISTTNLTLEDQLQTQL